MYMQHVIYAVTKSLYTDVYCDLVIWREKASRIWSFYTLSRPFIVFRDMHWLFSADSIKSTNIVMKHKYCILILQIA